jgi:hypothetical protein
MSESRYRFEEVEEIAARKRFTVKRDSYNPGYCFVWRKREVLRTEYGAETLTYEEAMELLAEWPDVTVRPKDREPRFERLRNLGRQKLYHVVFHRVGGIEIENYSGRKMDNPKTGEAKFTLQEALEWLYQQPDR